MSNNTLVSAALIAGGATIITTGLILAPYSFQTVPYGYVGVKTTFGKIDLNELPPGLHFKIPVVQSIQLVNTQVQAITYKGNGKLADADTNTQEGLLIKPAIRVLEKRGLPIKVEMTVQYRVISDEAAELLKTWGKSYAEKLVNPTIRETVRDIIGKYTAENIPANRPAIATQIEDTLKRRIAQYTYNGKPLITIVAVQLRDIKLPEIIEKKIEQVQEAKLEAERTKLLVQKAEQKQRIKLVEAQTKYLVKIKEAQAIADAKLIQANATAKANKIIAQSITPELIEYIKAEALKDFANKAGNSVKTLIIGGGVQPFINLPSQQSK